MLLSNTNTVNTINLTTGNGPVIGGVALRGCSAGPAHFAERPSEKRAGCDRFSDRSLRQHSSGQMSYSGKLMSWRSPWQNFLPVPLTTSEILLGFASGRSLS